MNLTMTPKFQVILARWEAPVLFENLQHLIRHVFRALGSAKDANLRHQHR